MFLTVRSVAFIVLYTVARFRDYHKSQRCVSVGHVTMSASSPSITGNNVVITTLNSHDVLLGRGMKGSVLNFSCFLAANNDVPSAPVDYRTLDSFKPHRLLILFL